MTTLAVTVKILGGLSLFIYGMELLSGGMQDLAGQRMRQWVGSAVRHRWAGLVIGFVLTFFMQSSSASTVLYVSLVESGMLAFKYTIALMLGAMVGSALTAQLIAFQIADYALLLVALGALVRLSGKYRRQQDISNILVGVALLFYGIFVMRDGAAGLKDNRAFLAVFEQGLRYPWLGLLISTVFTALTQGSTATVAIAFSFASAGLLGHDMQTMLTNALPLVLGANVGAAATALIAALRSSRAGMRCALANAWFRIVSAAICMFFLPGFATLTLWISNRVGMDDVGIVRAIANSHLLFGVANVVLYLPFVYQIAALFTWMLPDKPKVTMLPELAGPVPSPHDFNTEYARLCHGMGHCLTMVVAVDDQLAEQVACPSATQLERIAADDQRMDQAYEELRGRATLLFRLPAMYVERDMLARVIRAAEVIERLADDFSRSTVRVLQKMLRADAAFSLESAANLQSFLRAMRDILCQLAASLSDTRRSSPQLHHQIGALKTQLESMRRSHFQALGDNIPAAIKSSEYLLDVLSELESSINKIALLAKFFGQQPHVPHPAAKPA